MKLKLLLAYTTTQFYMTKGYKKNAVLRYQPVFANNKGFYVGSALRDIFKRLDSPLKKL